MAEQIVSSFNIFVDTDRGARNSTSKGDDYQLNLTGVNLDMDKGQICRLTVNSFSMYKTFTNVNIYNSNMNLRTVGQDGVSRDRTVTLTPSNHDKIYEIAKDFGEQLATQLQAAVIAAGTAGVTATLDPATVTPAASVGVAGTSNNVIAFTIKFTNGGTNTAHNLTSALVQFRETIGGVDQDTYSLLGGDRLAPNDTINSSITVDVSVFNEVRVTCKYPAQRHTEQFVYLRTNLTSNTLATSSLEAGHHTRDVTNVHHSNILGRFIIDTEVVQFSAGTGREYFIDLTSQRHVNNIRLHLTDHHGRDLPGAIGQNTLGNLNFSLVLRCDIIQKRAPNEGFTQPVQRSTPARFSNLHLQEDGHNRT